MPTQYSRTDISSQPSLDEIAKDLIAHTRERTQADSVTGFAAPLKKYNESKDREGKLQAAIQTAAALTPEEKLKASKALATERIVLNALGNMYRKAETPSPEQRFKTYFDAGLKGTEQERNDFIATLQDVSKKMIISVVQTMHPTIYHTKFARESEKELTRILEGIVDKQKKGEDTSKDVAEAKKRIDSMVQNVLDGKEQITPNQQVTVPQENALDRDNHLAMRESFEKVVVPGYNKALALAIKEARQQGHFTDAQADDILKKCAIKDSQAQWRTWAYGADADGRDKATSLVLSDGIYHQGEDKYISRKRDLRENAKDEKECVSSLVQRLYRKQVVFRNFCDEFLKANDKYAGQRIGWKDPRGSTVLQLSEEEQQLLFKTLITGDYTLKGSIHLKGPDKEKLSKLRLLPDSLKEETIKFNRLFRDEYKKFVDKHGLRNKEGLLPEISSLDKEQRAELAKILHQKELTSGENKELIRFVFDSDNLLYFPEYGENRNFFRPASKTEFTIAPDGKPHAGTREFEDKERRKLLDVVKRLQVVEEGEKKFGYQGKVADRYQIANFENASDFYATLLLFKETGIIEVSKEGKVVGLPVLSLQPLLETEQDQAKAPAMFEKLLNDPLVVSYYKGLGSRAEIMVGYSDGSKSAGNLASEWSIYKCTRKLDEIFKAKGIHVTFLHGRGRGDSRGGHFDEGQNYLMTPPELQEGLRYDETLQSDAPMNGAISASRGQDSLASIVEGVITGAREAKKWRKDGDYRKKLEAQDGLITTMADTSKEEYLRLVGGNKNTVKLLQAVHDSPYKSSRASARKDNPTLEDLRAITVEYGLNTVCAPLNYIGLKKALTEFTRNYKPGVGQDGNALYSGMSELEKLYDAHPFFRRFLDKAAQGLKDYDPEIFRQYAQVAGVDNAWVKNCTDELDGMREMVESIRARKEMVANHSLPALKKQWTPQEIIERGGRMAQFKRGAYNPLEEAKADLGRSARALALSFAKEEGKTGALVVKAGDGKPDAEKTRDMTLLNASFVCSEDQRDRGERIPAAIRASVEHESSIGKR